MWLYYLLTLFAVTFRLNNCYSAIISNITEEARIAAKTHNQQRLENLVKRLDSMPMQGYETDCKAAWEFIEK